MHRTTKLPGNCYVGRISVNPRDWKTRSKKQLESDIENGKDWYVHYRFYDPNYPKPKQVIIKFGINEWTTLQDRREAIKLTIQKESTDLENGWNPITESFEHELDYEYEINPKSTILEAFTQAVNLMDIDAHTRKEYKSILKYTGKAIKKLSMSGYHICNLKRRHIRVILNQIGKIKGPEKWTKNNYNHYRKHYSCIFRELVECETVEYNFIRDIKKKKTIKKLREVITLEERKQIFEYLSNQSPEFLRFIIIFFHSGRRTSELMNVKRNDVYFDTQEFKVIQKKGDKKLEVLVPIKNIALPYWLEATKNAEPNDFIFSKGLIPGPLSISPRQITKRWRLWIKGDTKPDVGLGIKKDFYLLKHTNIDEISGLIGLQTASAAAGHTSTRTTEIYAVNEKKRQMELIKNISNPFVDQ